VQVVGHPAPSAGRDLSLLSSQLLPSFGQPIDSLKSLEEDPSEQISLQRNLTPEFSHTDEVLSCNRKYCTTLIIICTGKFKSPIHNLKHVSIFIASNLNGIEYGVINNIVFTDNNINNNDMRPGGLGTMDPQASEFNP
jgi:hypothetical protein